MQPARKRRYSQSSSFKMAALFTVLLGASALLLGYFLHDYGEQNFLRETEAAIDSHMQQVLQRMDGLESGHVVVFIDELAAKSDNPVYLYQHSDGRVLAGTLKQPPSSVSSMKEGMVSFRAMLSGKSRLVAAKIHTFYDGSRLMIGRDVHEIEASYEQLKLITLLIISFMLIVVVVSFFISTFVVRRINGIAETAQQIIHTGDLSQRISVSGSWDDLSHLAQLLNHMFSQLESLMQGVRDVSNNIAHDLRTPLTRIRQQLEQASESGLPPEEVKRLLAEADHLLGIFGSLLRISRIERVTEAAAHKPVDLAQITRDVIELYEPVAEAKQQSIEAALPGSAGLSGDADLLFQLIANLLDNAIKYSPPSSVVCITLTQHAGKIALVIADQGAGISLEDRTRVFQRFYRGDASRNTPGSGLGLSLVKAILVQHGADIQLADNHPGLKIIINFT